MQKCKKDNIHTCLLLSFLHFCYLFFEFYLKQENTFLYFATFVLTYNNKKICVNYVIWVKTIQYISTCHALFVKSSIIK